MLGAVRRGESPHVKYHRKVRIVARGPFFFPKTLQDREFVDPVAVKYHYPVQKILGTCSLLSRLHLFPSCNPIHQVMSSEMNNTTSQPATASPVGPDNPSASHLTHTARDPVGAICRTPPAAPHAAPRTRQQAPHMEAWPPKHTRARQSAKHGKTPLQTKSPNAEDSSRARIPPIFGGGSVFREGPCPESRPNPDNHIRGAPTTPSPNPANANPGCPRV